MDPSTLIKARIQHDVRNAQRLAHAMGEFVPAPDTVTELDDQAPAITLLHISILAAMKPDQDFTARGITHAVGSHYGHDAIFDAIKVLVGYGLVVQRTHDASKLLLYRLWKP